MNKSIYRFISLAVAFALLLGASSQALAAGALPTEMGGGQAALLAGNTYYVSPGGSDSNPGTSAAPFRTFAKAVSVLAPGDTLQVMSGIYYEPLLLSKSGAAGAPITVIGNGAALNMRGLNNNGIRITGSYLNVSNFEVTGASDAGITISGQYVTVRNNVLHDNVTDNGYGTCGTAGSYTSALKVGVGGVHITIEGNTVYNNCGEGIAITRGLGVVVRSNTVFDNFAPNIYIDNSPYTIVESNLVYCTGARLGRDGTRPTGIGLGEESYSGWGAQMHDILIVSNTIRDCRNGIGAFDSEVGGTLANVTITRNTIPSGQSRSIAMTNESNSNVVISYNTLFNAPLIESGAGVTLIGNNILGVTGFTCTSITTRPNAASPVTGAGNLTWYISSTGNFLFGESGDILVPSDYNGDCRDDIAVYRPSNGTWYISSTGDYRFGEQGDIPVPADYNGDGRVDIAVWRPSNGTWYISSTGNFRFGEQGDIPVPADYDGDWKADIAVYRPSNGTWYISSTGNHRFGEDGDIPLPADYNGDRRADITVYRPSNGTWYISSTGDYRFGEQGDIPLPGDYNGDRRADIAVSRP